MIVLRLLGGLALEADGAGLPPAAMQRRRLLLLALLGLSGERGMSRERIQSFLWPESTAERARHALDQLLYSSRRDLGSDAIHSGAGGLSLNPARIRCDAAAFDELIASKRWDGAVAMYAGPVLEGVHLPGSAEFDRWMEDERERFARAYCQALETLAREAEGRGAMPDAVQWWRKRAAAEPLSAPIAVALMRALAAAGDRAGALLHAQVHERLMRQALDLPPDAVVLATARELSAPPASCTAAERSSQDDARVASPWIATDPVRAPAGPVTVVASADGVPSTRQRASRTIVGNSLVLAALVAVALAASSHGRPGSAQVASPARPEVREGVVTSGAPPRRADDLEAERLYRRGRDYWNQRTRVGLEQAITFYRRAAERDPLYGQAFAGMAEAYAMLGYFGYGPPETMFAKARAAAERALELDPANGDALAALGQVRAWEHDWDGAERAYRSALSVSPDNATVHQWYALMLAYMGRTRESVGQTAIASRLDPLSVQINNFHGVMLFYSGDLASSLAQFARTVDAEPDSAWVRRNPWVLSNYASIASAAGYHAQALALLHRALQADPRNPRLLLDLARVQVRMADSTAARATFARADKAHPHYRLYRGLLHAVLGERDEAFRWIARVEPWPLAPLVGLNNDPSYASLRADPRFTAVRRRLRMAP